MREDSYEVTTHIAGSKPERHPVSSLAAASDVARQAIDDAGIGASDMGKQHGVLKRNGRVIGHVAYNGRIFDLDDKIMWDNRGVREDHEAAEPRPLRRARFGFETGPMAIGWTTGETWNGFAVPLFEAGQLAEAFKVLRQVGLKVRREGPVVIIDDPESGTSDRYESTQLGGRRVWKLDGFTWLEVGQRAAPTRGRMREGALDIPGWNVGYNREISASAATRRLPGKRDWLFVMTTPEDHEPRSLDDEVAVGLYFLTADGDWEQVGFQDFPDVSSVIRLNDAELQLLIEHGLSMDQARDLLVQEFDEWEESDGEASIMPWMATILKDAGIPRPGKEAVEVAAHEAAEQIRNASPAQILAYMNERSEALNE